MKGPRAEELQTIVAQGRLDRAAAILQRLDPTVAADTFMSMPYEDQQVLFRRLPIDFAAALAAIFPYYHTFVLLHALQSDQMTAVVEKMNPIERSRFFDELPEVAWQQITEELSEQQSIPGLAEEPAVLVEKAGIERVSPPIQPDTRPCRLAPET